VTDPSRFDDPNLAMPEIAVQALGDLCELLVFVGGCARGLQVTTGEATGGELMLAAWSGQRNG
jgi:hypothetical protein